MITTSKDDLDAREGSFSEDSVASLIIPIRKPTLERSTNRLRFSRKDKAHDGKHTRDQLLISHKLKFHSIRH